MKLLSNTEIINSIKYKMKPTSKLFFLLFIVIISTRISAMEKILRQRQNGKQNRRRRAQEMLQERQRKNRELLEKMEQEAENQEQNLSPEEVRQKRDELDNQMAQTDMRRKCLSPYAQKVFDNGAEEACPMCREEVPTKWPICSNGHGLCPDCTKEHLRFSRYHRCPTCREPMLLFFIK